MDTLRDLKKAILVDSFKAGACHIGSALSCIEIVKAAYDRKEATEIFLFGKATGAAALYEVLASNGHFPKDQVAEYLKNYPLPSTEVPGVLHSFGSVGHALPIAVGLAYAQPEKHIICLVSDGDLQEGTAYESALFARQHKISNLEIWVDDNGLVACGATSDILDLETAYEFFQKTFLNFTRIKTIKGKGVDFMENDYTWHYRNLTAELLEEALRQI